MFFENIPYIGEIFSLSSAVIWAFAVILFKKTGDTVHPIGLNIFKNMMAVLLFFPTLWFYGQTIIDPNVSVQYYLIIYLSGAIGIGIADTLFFQCLNRLGASLTAIVDCFYSPFVILFSFLWLGESLSFYQFIGVALIISAVIIATRRKSDKPLDKKNMIIGTAYGISAMVLMALGVILVKPILNDLPLLWVTQHRLLSGLVVLSIVIAFHPRRKPILKSIVSTGNRFNMITGSFFGAYLAMIIWLAGIKLTQASTASALNQTTNIFIFIFAAIFLKEAITRQKIFGIVAAVGGAVLITFG